MVAGRDLGRGAPAGLSGGGHGFAPEARDGPLARARGRAEATGRGPASGEGLPRGEAGPEIWWAAYVRHGKAWTAVFAGELPQDWQLLRTMEGWPVGG